MMLTRRLVPRSELMEVPDAALASCGVAIQPVILCAMRLGTFLLAMMVTCASSCAEPDLQPPEQTLVKNRPGTANQVDIRAIYQEPARFVGKSLTVSGILHRAVLYADIDAFYQMPVDIMATNGATLGLESPDTKPIDEPAYRFATFHGRLETCETLLQQRYEEVKARVPKDGVLLWDEFCVKDSLRLLVDRSDVLGPAPVVRQLPVRSAPGYGNLVPATEGWKPLPLAQSWAERFLAALQPCGRTTPRRWRSCTMVILREAGRKGSSRSF